MSNAPSTPISVVAVTGSRTFLGTQLLRQLSDDPSIDQLIAVDIHEPDVISDKLTYLSLDLTSPTAGMELTKELRDKQVDTIVHGAFLSTPTHALAWAHELEDVGTMHLLDACAELQPARLLLPSTTLVYGASASNPNYLSEEAKLPSITESRFVNDKIKAEEQLVRFARNHEDVAVCSLRFAPILGPTIINLFTRFLSRPVAPTIVGFDPLMQCVHERDAVAATLLALRSSARGAFNIVGTGILPYSTVLALLGRVPLPMPTPVAKLLARVMWATQLSEVPPTLLDLLRHICVADGQKARDQLGFVPSYDIKQTLSELLGFQQDSITDNEQQGRAY